jgi:outer membrane biogenesis lipoprotein LolB
MWDLVRWLMKRARGQIMVGLALFILSACAAPTQPPEAEPAIRHAQFAASRV